MTESEFKSSRRPQTSKVVQRKPEFRIPIQRDEPTIPVSLDVFGSLSRVHR